VWGNHSPPTRACVAASCSCTRCCGEHRARTAGHSSSGGRRVRLPSAKARPRSHSSRPDRVVTAGAHCVTATARLAPPDFAKLSPIPCDLRRERSRMSFRHGSRYVAHRHQSRQRRWLVAPHWMLAASDHAHAFRRVGLWRVLLASCTSMRRHDVQPRQKDGGSTVDSGACDHIDHIVLLDQYGRHHDSGGHRRVHPAF
jgi:hypothetical protein